MALQRNHSLDKALAVTQSERHWGVRAPFFFCPCSLQFCSLRPSDHLHSLNCHPPCECPSCVPLTRVALLIWGVIIIIIALMV